MDIASTFKGGRNAASYITAHPHSFFHHHCKTSHNLDSSHFFPLKAHYLPSIASNSDTDIATIMDNGIMMAEPSSLGVAWEHIKLQIAPFCSMATIPRSIVDSLSDHEKKIIAEGLK